MVKLILTSDTHYGIDGKTHNKHVKFWKRVKEAIEKENIQALIWAGDLASTRQRNLRQSLEMARKYIDIPILLVRGNHDFWDGSDDKCKERTTHGPRSLDRLFELHKEWFKQYNIRHLEDSPYVIDDVIICGFDGWYSTPNPGTNDKKWMPEFVQGVPQVSGYLVNKAWKDLQTCLDIDVLGYRKSVLVTHHNPYPFSPQSLYILKSTDELLAEGITNVGHSANLKFLPEIREKFDVMCCGHTHGYKEDSREGIMIYNCGSDYNDPKYLTFKV